MNLKTTLLTIALAGFSLSLAIPGPAAAGINPPVVGTYKTLTGQVLPGHATESNPCDMCEGQLGNMIDAQSWDGATLGTQWKLTCPQISGPTQLTYDGVVGGNGQRIYQTSYSGGALTLAGTGPWGTGDPTYTAPISALTVIVTKQYVGGNLVGAVSNINLFGSFDGYGNCFSMAISNAEFVGATGVSLPASPGSYPPFEGPSDCNLTGTHGTYWDVHDITFSILGQCSVPTHTSTWGQLKSIYR